VVNVLHRVAACIDVGMRAVRVHELIGPAGLRVDDDAPEPRVAGGHVVIAVAAAGVNFPDLLMTRGLYQFKPALPFSPGGECAGTVTAVGDGVTAFAVGDRVACTLLSGAFAERIAVPALACAKLPAEVSFPVGAATLLTYLTTRHALIDRAAIRAGETLLVLGAAGGVGVAAIELGKRLGARVIAVASSEAKRAFCKEHGADEAIGYEALKDDVKRLTKGNGVDVCYDPVGGDAAEQALRGMAWQGRYLVVGFAAGEIPKIPLNLVLLKGCQIVGVFWGSYAMRDPAGNRAHAEAVLADVASGKLRVAVEEVLPFERAREALERLERREVKGKLVLVPR
jgi:NADPH2:quinone reductase